MAWDDPITDKQIGLIRGLSEAALGDPDMLDVVVEPIYGCKVEDFNRAQASMLIDDLHYELGETDEMPDFPSIFGVRVPIPRPALQQKLEM